MDDMNLLSYTSQVYYDIYSTSDSIWIRLMEHFGFDSDFDIVPRLWAAFSILVLFLLSFIIYEILITTFLK